MPIRSVLLESENGVGEVEEDGDMREIKFRAYWKPGKVMITNENIESINFETKVLGVYHPIGDIGYHKLRMSDFGIMQFTGLHDRNGKEIYESDVVKMKTDIFEKFTGQVVYAGVSYLLDGVGMYKRVREDLFNSCEVIGNIYQNAELLEATP